MQLFDEFINDVNDNPTHHCQYVKLAVERHHDDIKASKAKKYPYRFDVKRAMRAIDFIRLLRHTEGELAGKPFNLQPFQAFIIGSIFGWVNKTTGHRRFTKAYIEIPRKNGKTQLAAAIADYMLVADREAGAQIFSAATKKDQAKICYRAAERMMRMLSRDSRTIKKNVKFTHNNMAVMRSGSFFRPLAANSDTEDGLNPHCAVIDEYHAHPNDNLLKVLETGQGSRTQPLMFIITTAGYNRASVCYNFRRVVVGYLEKQLENAHTFAIIFTLDDADDWNDREVWRKANPNIGNTPYWHYMDTQYNNAINEGAAAEIEFKTKNLNIWTGTAQTWIQSEHIRDMRAVDIGGEYIPQLDDNAEVLIGIDLSSVRDTTAVSIYAPGVRMFETHVFIPHAKAEDRKLRDGVNFRNALQGAHIHTTPGNVVDYDFIEKFIFDTGQRLRIRAIAYDPFNSSQLVINLQDKGFEMIQFRQGFITMSPVVKALNKAILRGEVWQIYNPIIEYMFANVMLKVDANDNWKLDKQKSTGRIDGVVAMVMAFGLSMHPDYQGIGTPLTEPLVFNI